MNYYGSPDIDLSVSTFKKWIIELYFIYTNVVCYWVLKTVFNTVLSLALILINNELIKPHKTCIFCEYCLLLISTFLFMFTPVSSCY